MQNYKTISKPPNNFFNKESFHNREMLTNLNPQHNTTTLSTPTVVGVG